MITDYASLKASINSKMERDFTDDQLNEFVQLAEVQVRRKLVGYQREITSTWTTDADALVALPTDFIGIRSVYFGTQPYKYSISGSNLTVSSGASRAFDVTYYGKIPALSDANSTNWLLDEAPDVYQKLTEAQAREHLEDWQVAIGLKAEGLSLLDELNLQSTIAQYSRTGLVVNGGLAP